MEAVRYGIIQDNDGHWYIVPADKREEAEAYFEAVSKYWEADDPDWELAAEPEWLREIGGSYSLLTFENPLTA